METAHWTIVFALLCSVCASILGWNALRQGKRSPYTLPLMVGVFVAQCAFLYVRGEQRGQCPLSDWGEILLFIGWSLSLFYLSIGPVFRVSLLGFFTAPLLSFFFLVALLPDALDKNVTPISTENVDYWGEMHAALSVLSYGALALAAVASVMFLLLDKKLKNKEFQSSLFQNLPPIFQLLTLTRRLLWLGVSILTAGILSSLKMENMTEHLSHLWVATGVWSAYVFYLLWNHYKGMTPKVFSSICCFLFIASLLVFGVLP